MEFIFNGKKIYYETMGEGQPILLLNGIMMSTGSWENFKESFSANNRLILLDFLDQGRSARMTGRYDHSVQVEVVGALLDHLNIKEINLVGVSYGSSIALQFAILHPTRVRKMVLFNATCRTGPQLRAIGKAWNEATKLPTGEGYYYTTIPPIYSTAFWDKHLDWMQEREKTLIAFFGNDVVRESLVRLTDSSENYDVSEQLWKIACPTLVVSCTDDQLVPPAEQRSIAEGIADSQLVVIPDCGHCSFFEAPDLFTSLSLGWVNSKTVKIF